MAKCQTFSTTFRLLHHSKNIIEVPQINKEKKNPKNVSKLPRKHIVYTGQQTHDGHHPEIYLK